MGDEAVDKLLSKLLDLDRKVGLLVAEKDFNTKVPLVLREAAEVCHVELIWLRERVARKEIKAYRSGAAGSWRVFPADVKAYLMSETNQKPAKRKSVLKMAV